jgi:hypothetical protein
MSTWRCDSGNDELEEISEEAVVVYSNVKFHNLVGGTEKNQLE